MPNDFSIPVLDSLAAAAAKAAATTGFEFMPY
jgi:hypothetical protein